jgi:SanA protein
MTKKKKQIIGITLLVIAILIFTPICFYKLVENKSADKLYNDVNIIPYNEVGMVLGTNPNTKKGSGNPYFYNRVNAVEKLYKAGKIKFILISGDNKTKDYSEPDVMRKILIERGIPKDVIYIDYAGFRTLDSVVRAKNIFGQTKMTVISQKFHNERSIVLGEWQEMDLIGFNAKDVEVKRSKYKTLIREGGARVKLYLDMLIGKEPHFGGEPIKIAVGHPQTDLNE